MKSWLDEDCDMAFFEPETAFDSKTKEEEEEKEEEKKKRSKQMVQIIPNLVMEEQMAHQMGEIKTTIMMMMMMVVVMMMMMIVMVVATAALVEVVFTMRKSQGGFQAAQDLRAGLFRYVQKHQQAKQHGSTWTLRCYDVDMLLRM